MKKWCQLSAKGKIRRLLKQQRDLEEKISDLEVQIDGLQAQIRHAAGLPKNGIQIFPGRHGAMEIPALPETAKKLLTSLPK